MKNNILYSINSSYIPMMLASIYSLIVNSELNNLKFHIITEHFTKEDYNRIITFFQNYPEIEYKFYPLEEFDIAKYSIPEWHGTQIANARLFFEDIIGPKVEKMDNLLYLDSDTIVVDELLSLQAYKDNLYAAKDSVLRSYAQKLDNLFCYYNSGVIYINIRKWLEGEYQSKIIHTIKHKNLTLTCPDQDIFNCALKHNIHPLPIAYNMSPHALLFNGLLEKIYYNEKIRFISDKEIRLQKKCPKILHSYGLANIKPWDSSINPFHEQYMKYILTVEPNFIPNELEPYKRQIIKIPHLYYLLILSRGYMPEAIEEKVKTISSHLHNKKK